MEDGVRVSFHKNILVIVFGEERANLNYIITLSGAVLTAYLPKA
jgi:hypothetical protein